MILEALAKLIEENTDLVRGTSLFGGELPLSGAETAVSIQYVPSPDPNKAIRYYEQTIDFWSRSANTDTAYQNLLDIQEFLHGKANYSIDGYHVYLSYLMGSIQDADRDVDRRKNYKMSMRFIYRKDDVPAS